MLGRSTVFVKVAQLLKVNSIQTFGEGESMLSGEPQVLLCLYSKADLLHDVYLSLNSDKRLLGQQRRLLYYIDNLRISLVLITGTFFERSKLHV